MAQWNESEHPRKYDGTFTYKGAGASGTAKTSIERVRNIFEARKVEKVNGKSYNVNNDYKEPIQSIKAVSIQRQNTVSVQRESTVSAQKKKSDSKNLPNIIYIRFKRRIAAINHGEYYKKTPNGKCSVVIDGDNGFLYEIEFTGDISNSQIVGYHKISYEKAGREDIDIKEIKNKYDD